MEQAGLESSSSAQHVPVVVLFPTPPLPEAMAMAAFTPGSSTFSGSLPSFPIRVASPRQSWLQISRDLCAPCLKAAATQSIPDGLHTEHQESYRVRFSTLFLLLSSRFLASRKVACILNWSIAADVGVACSADQLKGLIMHNEGANAGCIMQLPHRLWQAQDPLFFYL